MKILIVSSFLPYPLFSGGHVRLYNLVKLLGQHHEITLLCEKRSHQTLQDIKEVEKICKKVIVVERKKQWQLSNILKSGFSSYPFLLVGHDHAAMKNEIQKLLSVNTFDLIHVETFYVMQNLPEVHIPVVLVEHNIEYKVYERFAKKAPIFLQPFLLLDITKMRHWERYFWKKATKLVAVSEDERKLMNRNDVEIVPNGVDIRKFTVRSSQMRVHNREKRILFIGDFKWIQNRDSVEWILKEIWPIINEKLKNKNIKLWIVGRSISNSIKKLSNDPSVIFDENASIETENIFEQAEILLAPIRVGGGTSYKILEAMASGVPVVTTSLGREGIEVNDNKEILALDSAEHIADAVISLLNNQKKYQEIAQNARRLIEEKYNWKEIVKKLETVYLSAVSKN